MRILLNQGSQSSKFITLTNALHFCKDFVIGVSADILPLEEIIGFKPDILIHNVPEYIDRFKNQKFLQIYIHDGKPIGFSKSIDLSTIGPVIDLKLYSDVVEHERFNTNFALCGEPSLFDSYLDQYKNQPLSGLRIYCDTVQAHHTYCGFLKKHLIPSVYKSAKTSLFSLKDDMSRLYEIIYAGGNPLIYDPNNPSQFIKDMNGVTYGKIPVYIDLPSIKTVHNVSANTIKFANALRGIGFNQLANHIMSNKNAAPK